MSDANKTEPSADAPAKPSRKSAADQAAEAKAAAPGPGNTGAREVTQTITTQVTLPVKDGQTISDAVKDHMVQQGGFEGSPVLPGPSGAIMEREVREGQGDHMDHPAIDSNPRRGLPATALQRDMNDPRFDREDASQGQVSPGTAT